MSSVAAKADGSSSPPADAASSLSRMLAADLATLEAALRACWCAETAHSPEAWSAENPAAGQCWTSAFVIRHFLGGEIVLAELAPRTDPIQRHAWNRLPDGTEIDLTRGQFPESQEFRLCEVPEEIIVQVSGRQAQLLLERVRGYLGRGV